MCDCDKKRLLADTSHPTYKSVIKRNSVSVGGRILSKKQIFLKEKNKNEEDSRNRTLPYHGTLRSSM